jgi:hypothetical protein
MIYHSDPPRKQGNKWVVPQKQPPIFRTAGLEFGVPAWRSGRSDRRRLGARRQLFDALDGEALVLGYPLDGRSNALNGMHIPCWKEKQSGRVWRKIMALSAIVMQNWFQPGLY